MAEREERGSMPEKAIDLQSLVDQSCIKDRGTHTKHPNTGARRQTHTCESPPVLQSLIHPRRRLMEHTAAAQKAVPDLRVAHVPGV